MKSIPSIALSLLLCSCLGNNTKETKSETSSGGNLLVEAYNKGDWEKILSICDTLYNEDDTRNVAIVYSEALAATGNYDESIVVLDRKIAQDPSNYYIFQSKGNTYSVAEQYDSAIYYYDKVIEMKPTYARPYVNKGDIYERIGDNQHAVASYLEAVHLFAGNGFKDEVYMYCKRILDLDSTNSDAKEYLLLLQNSNH